MEVGANLKTNSTVNQYGKTCTELKALSSKRLLQEIVPVTTSATTTTPTTATTTTPTTTTATTTTPKVTTPVVTGPVKFSRTYTFYVMSNLGLSNDDTISKF